MCGKWIHQKIDNCSLLYFYLLTKELGTLRNCTQLGIVLIANSAFLYLGKMISSIFTDNFTQRKLKMA